MEFLIPRIKFIFKGQVNKKLIRTSSSLRVLVCFWCHSFREIKNVGLYVNFKDAGFLRL